MHKKVLELKMIFKDALKWYEQNKLDKDLIYDESYHQFNNLDRGDCEDILKILSEL